jgi:PBSX family phage terminase large subunit
MIKTEELVFQPQPYQEQVLYSLFKEKKKAVAFVGGIKTGKTWLGARATLMFATTNPRSLCWIVAPDFTMADVCRSEIETILYSQRGLLFKTKEKPFWRVEFPNGSSIHLRSADRPHTLRGPNVDFIWVDEAAYLPNKNYDGETFDILLGRTAATRGQILLTTTPSGRNWLYERFVAKPDKDYAIFKATINDNIYVSDEEKERLYKQYTGAFRRQELEGEFVNWEGLIFPNFSQEKVVKKYSKNFSSYDLIVLGIDWGYSAPSAIVAVGLKEGIYWVIGEYYQRQVSIGGLCNVINSFIKTYEARLAYVDPSTTLLIQELQAEGLPVMPAKRESVLMRIGKISSLLDADKLKITVACPNLIREMLNYMFKTPEKPMEGQDDHAIDALGYAIISMPYIQPKETAKIIQNVYIPDKLDLAYEKSLGKGEKRKWITGY